MNGGPRLKDLGQWFSGGTPPRDDEAAWQGLVPWLSAKDIDRDRQREPTEFITEEAARSSSRVLPASSILMIVRGMALTHGLPVVLTDRRAAFNQDLRGLVPTEEFEPRYLHYALIGNRERLGVHIDKAAHGTARVVDSIYAERIHVPTRSSQVAIAGFLDRESERIQAASLAASRFADSLEEERRDVFERLTFGTPTVPLRHLLARIEQGWSPECEARTADVGEWGVLKVGCVNHGRFRAEEQKRLPDDTQPRPHLEVHPGDILMSRANTRELVGSAALVEETSGRRLMLCDILYRLVPTDGIRPRFLTRALMSQRVRSQIEAAAAGAAGSMPKISQSIIRALRVPDLSLDEQRRVELITDEHTHRVTAAVKRLTLLDARLTEYRDALITEAVTGRLDVTKLSESQLDESAHAVAEGQRPEVLTS